MTIQDKLNTLQNYIARWPNLLIAYSGGVDSTFLLKVATDTLSEKARGIIGVSPSLAKRELNEALQVAQEFGLYVDTINTQEMADPNYRSNPDNRCYFCKKELFSEIYDYARQHGFNYIADGTNGDDVGDHRPGLQAAEELQIRSPLKDARLSKSEIRQLSQELGLPTWNKPEMACLSSRFPTGVAITDAGLQQVEKAEDFLKQLGFQQLRVRHHDKIARIEVRQKELPEIVKEKMRTKIDAYLKSLGYTFVTIDLAGYRRGSLSNAESQANQHQ
ncbi:MAG: ATP-dependent sacrificial sulfur transferase LarE [Aliifodinibius sp.]|nr:ATP-dependent sacrificial sulfur transferase LarE [Fodinibius sp.]